MEIGCEPGKSYAVSHWLVHTQLNVSHCGYSQALMKMQGVKRDFPHFATPPSEFDAETFEILRKWHSKVFTQNVPRGFEELYRLSISISHLFFGQHSRGGELIGGVFYPSVGLRGEADNIGLLPSEVDSKLSLIEVSFHRVDGTLPDRHGMVYPNPTPLNFARADAAGNLVWNQKSQLIPNPAKTIQVLLPD
jgi:hypothetical protein